MSIIGSNVLAGASGGAVDTGYQIQRSLRFNSGDTPELTRTPSSAGNTSKFTISFWAKRSKIGSTQMIVQTGNSYSNLFRAYWDGSDYFRFHQYSGSYLMSYITSARYRDPSAWYHYVISIDTTLATAANRARLYVNGVEVTEWSTETNPAQNLTTGWNAAIVQRIGREYTAGYGNYYNYGGYIAEFYNIDGQQLAPTDFGEFDDNNVWQPKEFSGTYGTNGFHLDFSDNSSNAALGYDAAGSNDWTVNNLSVASGAGNDSLVDTPTNYGDDTGAGNEVRGCYATFNPLSIKANQGTMENGNLTISATSNYYIEGRSTIAASSFDNYSELTISSVSSNPSMGFAVGDKDTWIITGGGAYLVYRESGTITRYPGNTTVATVASYTQGDVLGMAVDNTNVKFYKNGSLQGTYAHQLTGEYFVTAMTINGNVSGYTTLDVNFGQRAFAYAAPSGYKALCTQNLPEPTIADGSLYFDTKLYTGTGSSQTISGLNMSPDFVWIKRRSGSASHVLNDTVRGAGEQLRSNTTEAESTNTNNFAAFTSDGFTVGTGSGTNAASQTHVAWAWDAGANSSKTYAVTVVSDSGNKYRFDGFGTSAVTLDLEEGSTYTFDQSDSSNAGHPLRFSTTSDGTHGSGTEYTTGVTATGTPGSAGASTTIVVASGAPTLYYYCSVHSGMGGQANTNSTAGASNFDGSIQATVRANPTAGFSIVTWDASANATVAHGLNAAPQLVITKSRNYSTAWRIWSAEFSNADSNYLGFDTSAVSTFGGAYWGSMTSTTIGLSAASYDNNYGEMLAYCFAPVEGYSAMGSYTGNGSTDGPFVHTGFRVAFLMVRSTSGPRQWLMFDNTRFPLNGPNMPTIYAQASTVESTTSENYGDFLSNGFKARATNGNWNGNGETYIYIALAENAFSLNGGMAR